METTFRYEVRYTLYQYNGGSGISNGNIRFYDKFDTLEEALELKERLLRYLTIANKPTDDESLSQEETEFIHSKIWGGFVRSFDGIYGIATCETRMDK